MKVSNKNAILHNKYVLYLIFIIALGNLLTLVYTYDYYSASIFVLIGFLTSFFSKNMIVILFIAIAFTNIIKYGAKAGIEGIEGMTSDEEADTEIEAEEKEDTESEEKDKEKKKSVTSEKKETKPKATDDPLSLSVETNEGSNKEKFEQDKNIVYTSEEDKEMERTDKMILSQEKMLKSMNKYKPLLDTLQGITKNMALVKGATSTSEE
jgi:hypothetical protein